MANIEPQKATTLQSCIDAQHENHALIRAITCKVSRLLYRLRGPSPESCLADAGTEENGLLIDHLESLNSESVDVGRLLADVVELEGLL